MFYVGLTLVLIGCIFNLISAVGCLKMPDSYTMMHAAGVGDSCGTPIAILGAMFIVGFNIIALKLLILLVLILLLSPTATHALAKSGLEIKK